MITINHILLDKLRSVYTTKTLKILKVGNNEIDLSETNLSETEITELNFSWNKGTKVLKTENLPKDLQKLEYVNSEIDLSETDLSKTQIIELNFRYNTGTRTLNFDYLPLTLQKITIYDSLLLKENSNIVQELQAFFKKRNQKVEIIK